MLKLLREHELAPCFRRLTAERPPTVIAVPFWGEGAIARLGLKAGDDTRIICNLSSRACNPHVIHELKAVFGNRVRTNPKLHAKLYSTRHACIIGSSNASTNGLTIEGDALTGWIEANIVSDDPQLVSEALSMFEGVWADRGTVNVSASALKAAIAAWEALPPDVTVKARTLFAACRENPALFKSVFVAAYDESLSGAASSRLARLQGDNVPQPGYQASDFRNSWGYQYESTISPGSWLLDLDCRKPRKCSFRGCSRTGNPVLRLKIRGEADLTITHRGSVRLGAANRRFVLSAEEKGQLEVNAAGILAGCQGSVLPLQAALRIIDEARRTKRHRSP